MCAPVDDAVHALLYLQYLYINENPFYAPRTCRLATTRCHGHLEYFDFTLISPNTWMPQTAPCKTNASPEVQIFFVFYTNKQIKKLSTFLFENLSLHRRISSSSIMNSDNHGGITLYHNSLTIIALQNITVKAHSIVHKLYLFFS